MIDIFQCIVHFYIMNRYDAILFEEYAPKWKVAFPFA